MSFRSRPSSFAWIIVLICSCAFLAWINAERIQRVRYITGLAGATATPDGHSPTGYAGGLRQLIVPEHNNESYQLIAQTQQMLARGEWRIRHVDYDNAPFGREVRSPSPDRWWLGLVAWIDHAVSGRSLGVSVERAALIADPLLHLLLVISATFFVWWMFGGLPAALLSVGLTCMFPLAGSYLPGQPNDSGLALACALWSVLPLLVGFRRCRSTERSIREQAGRWFLLAGIAGGFGLWISVGRQVAVLVGIAVGGLLEAWFARRLQLQGATNTESVAPWRIWALGGAVTTLAAFLSEYFPSHLSGLRLETVHPLFGLAWIGTGELLASAAARIQGPAGPIKVRGIVTALLAGLAVAGVPTVIILNGGHGFVADDGLGTRLSNFRESAVASNLWAWIYRDGLSTQLIATCLPLLLLVPAGWLLLRRATEARMRLAVAVAAGPVLVVLALAVCRLGGWSMVDILLLTLVVVITSPPMAPTGSRRSHWIWSGAFALMLAPGVVLMLGETRADTRTVVTESDVVALVERDLAYWLANQAGPEGAVVLAPPNLTTSLYFHGGLSGLGTPYWENKDGFLVAVRIAGATSLEEAQAFAQRRHLTYIVLPSWDPFMDEYARLGSGRVEHSLVDLLHQWLPPRWLRPLPYHVPKIPGFEGWSVAIFQVTDVQDNPTALSRLAEYFVEMEQLDQAALVRQALERLFPTDLGALVARALVAHACGDTAGFTDAISTLPTRLARSEDSTLPWDRRVSLVIALTEDRRFELAREQTKRCLAELDEARLRALTTVSLYRLQVISKAFGLGIDDGRLHALALSLLPAEMRGNL